PLIYFFSQCQSFLAPFDFPALYTKKFFRAKKIPDFNSGVSIILFAKIEEKFFATVYVFAPK
ncbi:MAG: hypothetical protein IJQ82_10140, partial [Selenomonadaceae bacterium]|nr:hypothetical protein [Selenomonadaceae bacterium]